MLIPHRRRMHRSCRAQILARVPAERSARRGVTGHASTPAEVAVSVHSGRARPLRPYTVGAYARPPQPPWRRQGPHYLPRQGRQWRHHWRQGLPAATASQRQRRQRRRDCPRAAAGGGAAGGNCNIPAGHIRSR